jgi:hypothetical protein
MKYFTRDLLERCGSTDEAVASVAAREWEAANARYEEHLRSIEPRLPDHIRDFNNLLLHDALVWSIARQDDNLIMILRKDIPPRNLVILSYTLTREPEINPEALPPEQRLQVMDFQLDEFEVQEGSGTVYSQSILFGNGWEMTLYFSDVRVIQAEPLYPFPETMLIVPSSSLNLPKSA